MTFSSIQNSFTSGEISPDMFGRTDIPAKFHNGAFTMRNFFVNFRGGAASRAGLAYVGTSKQAASGNSNPPRLIPFQYNNNQGYMLEFGNLYMRVIYRGAYVTESTKNITAITQASPGVFTSASHGYSNGDWVYIAGVGGMTNFNGLTWIIQNATTNTYTLTDLFGNAINTTLFNAYTSGGTTARIYTVVSPYAVADLSFIKYTQSANAMSLTCWNQNTNTEYPPYDLTRVTNTNWTFTATTFATAISPPTGVTSTAQASTTKNTYYSYVVTAIDSLTGQESIASSVTTVENNDISINAGTNTITWTAVNGASSYNVYASVASYNVTTPVGVAFGFLGSTLSNSFIDTNIIADFTKTPPTNQNPFARGAITAVNITAGGSGYSQGTIGYTITTSTGSGFSGVPVVVSGALSAFVIQNEGSGYAPGDTIAITGGSSATATLTVGAATGTYPGGVAYFQQRRVYFNSINQPDTYWMSQPGNYTNFNSAIPVVDSDSITGTPWAQQINGLQFAVPMTTGLILLTGKGSWQLTGSGGPYTAVTPSSQSAQAQSYNGCNSTVAPIVVNNDILYIQSKGSIVRDLVYNFYMNVFTGTDTTIMSNHLFSYHRMVDWAYCEEPYKLIWVVRDDGTMLCLTYLKEQEVTGWTRHDTNGQFVSVASITEPPVNALYTVVKRYIVGQSKWMYYIERMDNRNWIHAEDSYCVDAGLSYPQTYPNATLTPASANGTSNISGTNIISGGSGYTSPTIVAIDSSGIGTGATFTANLTGGVITSVTVNTQGSKYTPGYTTLQITDSTGSGAIIQPVITNNVIFTTDASVFNSGMVGNVIRIGNNNANTTSGITTPGGGQATITSYQSGTQVTANMVIPITGVIPDDPNNMPAPAISGQWSISVPTTTVSGLNHLEGMTVAILADGSVVNNQVVTNGTITLPQAASAITVGLPYTCQLQTSYLDPVGMPTVQGKRKTIPNAVIRVVNSRGLSVGTNQPDASTQPNGANVPWTGMVPIKEPSNYITGGLAVPLLTTDHYINVPSDWKTAGQVAVQQDYPLPANIVAVVSQFEIGDSTDRG